MGFRGGRRAGWILLLCLLSVAAMAMVACIAGAGAAQGDAGADRTIGVVLVYRHGCAECEKARPVTAQALADVRSNSTVRIAYEEYVDSSPEGLGYVERYHLEGVPSLVIDNNSVIGPVEFQGDRGVVYNLIVRKITEASLYRVPVAVARTVVWNASDASLLDASATIRNDGNETVFASFSDAAGGGPGATPGTAAWEGALRPGESVELEYAIAVAEGAESIPGPDVSYVDADGSHVLLVPGTPVPTAYSFDPATLFFAGFIAGFNPCVIAIVVFIGAEVVAASGKRRDVVLNVLAFCLGILAVYLLVGAGLFEAVRVLPAIGGLLEPAVIAIVLALAAYAFYGAYLRASGRAPGAATRGLIAAARPLYAKYSLAGSLLLGGLFGLVKMPCAGGIYLAILSRIVLAGKALEGVAALLVFDAGVVLPVLALGLLLATGVGAGRLEAFRSRHAVFLHILNGSVLALLAAGLLLDAF